MTKRERADADLRIESVIDRIAAGDAPLTSNPAECRHCGYCGAGWCEGVTG